MDTAKIFENGKSQAVRLPKKYRFDSEDVFIKKIDNMVILIPKDKIWQTFSSSLDKFSEDLNFQKDDSLPQEREEI